VDDLKGILRDLGGTPAQLGALEARGELSDRVAGAYRAAGDPLNVAKAVSVAAGLKFFQPSRFVLPRGLFEVVPAQLALRFSFLPVKLGKRQLAIATSLPLDDETRSVVEEEGQRLGRWEEIVEVISEPSAIAEALETYYPASLADELRQRREGSEVALRQRIALGSAEPGPPTSPFATPSRGELRRAHWDMAYLCSRSGRQAEGLVHLETALELSDDLDEEAACLLAMGQLLEQLEDYERALERYSQARSREPGDRDTWYLIHNNLGYTLNQLGRPEEAEAYCRVGARVDPNRYNAHKNLGVSCELQGRYAEAARSYIRGVHATPLEPRSLTHLLHLLETKRDEVRAEFPELEEELRRCREVAAKARRARWE
jgi:tetratricopeptide (TPR) repeat protein